MFGHAHILFQQTLKCGDTTRVRKARRRSNEQRTSHCTGRGRISCRFHPVYWPSVFAGWISRKPGRAGEFCVMSMTSMTTKCSIVRSRRQSLASKVLPPIKLCIGNSCCITKASMFETTISLMFSGLPWERGLNLSQTRRGGI